LGEVGHALAQGWTTRTDGDRPAGDIVPDPIDGEGVVVDDRGVTDFDKLFAALARRGGTRAAFLYAFDLIEIDGDDVRLAATRIMEW
jgi:ATP-dependent DNA ligase